MGDPANRLLIPAYTSDELVEIASGQPASFDERRRLLISEMRRRVQASGIAIDDRHIEKALETMARVARERFVPEHVRDLAYLPISGDIGYGQTISNPYLVAIMTAAVQPGEQSAVLDVGTGSGYQAAVLAGIAGTVLSVEIVPALAKSARVRLAGLGYANVDVLVGDGAAGVPSRAPFDAIVVAAGAAAVPKPLLTQFAVGGRLVMPVGQEQPEELLVVERTRDAFEHRSLGRVRFVPLTGPVGRRGQERPP